MDNLDEIKGNANDMKFALSNIIKLYETAEKAIIETEIKQNAIGTAMVKAKAGAEAYLAKGEVSGGVTILGVDVDFGVEGMVGVQAEAGGKVSSTGVSVDVGIGPIGGKINIDRLDFELPEFKIPDFNWPWE